MRRTVVVVQVDDVAYALIVIAAAGSVDDTGIIDRTRKVNNLRGLELSPALVERCPYHDRRAVVMLFNDFLPLILESLLHGSGVFAGIGAPFTCDPGLIAATQSGHVLPNEDSKAVAVVVPACRLHFHVLANHVKAPVLGLLHIIDQCLVSGSGIETVGPIALVKESEVEHVAVVQLHTPFTVVQLVHGNLAHGGVALYAVTTCQRHLKVVEPRVGRTPQLGIGYTQLDGTASGAVSFGHCLSLQLQHYVYWLVLCG